MPSILIVEDDASTLAILRRALGAEHRFTECRTLKEAKAAILAQEFSLILLDVMLPDGDGFEFFNEVKKYKNMEKTPVLFLTGRSSVADQVLGFSLGAEDYIVKPIDPLVFQARVNSKIQKYARLSGESEVFLNNPLRFNLVKQRVYICPEPASLDQPNEAAGMERQEVELDLTSLEFKLLLHFAKREDQVFSRDQLMNAIWGTDVQILDRTVDTHVSRLRTKLRDNRSSIALEAVHGSGYRLTRKL